VSRILIPLVALLLALPLVALGCAGTGLPRMGEDDDDAVTDDDDAATDDDDVQPDDDDIQPDDDDSAPTDDDDVQPDDDDVQPDDDDVAPTELRTSFSVTAGGASMTTDDHLLKVVVGVPQAGRATGADATVTVGAAAGPEPTP
jgi:hypothetical protein